MEVKGLAREIVEFYEKLSSWEHEIVRGSDLTPNQMHAIEIIGHEKSLRMKELAGKLGVTTGTLTVTVDRLEKKGLICVHKKEQDKNLEKLLDKLNKGLKETVKDIFEKSLVAHRDISAGTLLSPELVAIKKPGTGISAARLDEFLGKPLRKDVEANEIFSESDFGP